MPISEVTSAVGAEQNLSSINDSIHKSVYLHNVISLNLHNYSAQRSILCFYRGFRLYDSRSSMLVISLVL